MRGTAGGGHTRAGRLQPPVRGEGTQTGARSAAVRRGALQLASAAAKRRCSGTRLLRPMTTRRTLRRMSPPTLSRRVRIVPTCASSARRAATRHLRRGLPPADAARRRAASTYGRSVSKALAGAKAYDSTATPSSSVKSGSTTSWAGSPGRSRPRSDSVRREMTCSAPRQARPCPNRTAAGPDSPAVGSRPRRRGAGSRPARPGLAGAVAKARGCARPDERRTQVICPSGRSA
jgi:hypothetical protein